MKKLFLLLALSVALFVPFTVYAAEMSGTVTEWRNGKQYPAVGVTVIIGKGINLNSGSTGTDVITGSRGIVAKMTTDSAGRFFANVPSGVYTVIGWKAGYVPQTYFDVTPANYLPVSCSPDNQVGSSGRHRSLEFR